MRIVAVIAFCLASLLPASAFSQSQQPDVQFGPAVFCDSAEQAVAIMQAEDHLAAMKKVNEANPVCGIGIIAFVVGEQVGETYTSPEGDFVVHKAVVLGILKDHVLMMTEPFAQFIPGMLPLKKTEPA